MIEETGAAPQQEEELLDDQNTGIIEEGSIVDGVAEAVQGEEDAFAAFGGEEVKVEKRQKDAHTATIQTVSMKVSEKGSHAVSVLFLSDDTGNEMTQDIWVPLTFAENTGAFLKKKLGIDDLPAGEPDPERPGKLKGNQRAHYGMSVKNSAGDASVQQLLAVAGKSGRTPGPLAQAFTEETTFEEYCNALHETLEGLQVVITRVPETSDENPRGFLKVNRVYPVSVKEDPKALKALKNYVRQWEIGQ